MCGTSCISPYVKFFSVVVFYQLFPELIRGDAFSNEESSFEMRNIHMKPPNSIPRSNKFHKPSTPNNVEESYIIQNPINDNYLASLPVGTASLIDPDEVSVGFTAITVHTPIPDIEVPELNISTNFSNFLEKKNGITMKVSLSKPERMRVSHLKLEDVIQVESPEMSSQLQQWSLDVPGDSFLQEPSGYQFASDDNTPLTSGIQAYRQTFRKKGSGLDGSGHGEGDSQQQSQQLSKALWGVVITKFSLRFDKKLMISDSSEVNLIITIEITQQADYFDLIIICVGCDSHRKSDGFDESHFLRVVSINFLEFTHFEFLSLSSSSLPQSNKATRFIQNNLQNSRRHLIDTNVGEVCPASCVCQVGTSLCVSCIAQHYLWNYECTPTWPIGTYCNNQNWLCYACTDTVRNCGNCDQAYVCTSCVSPNVLSNGSCIGSSASSNICPADCASCTNSSTCDACNTNYFLFNSVCYSTQPSQTHCANNICTACNGACETCTGASPSECTSCHVSTDLLYKNQCYAVQQPATYCVNNECWDCPSTCLTCTSAMVCQTCVASYFLYNNECILTPPTNTLCTTSPMACVTCDATCATCSGTIAHCDSCWQTTYYKYNNGCYTNQPPATTCDTNRNCVDSNCPADCSACTETTCTACNASMYLYNGSCSASQPASTFCRADLVCEACPAGCNTCVSSLSCQTCQSGYSISNNICVQSITCHADCSSCTGTASTDCLACSNANSYLYNHTCFLNQPPKTYCDAAKVCYDCLVGCNTCIDGSSCATCESSYYFFQNLCQQNQPTLAYCDSSKICVQCYSTCATCDSDQFNGCLSCLSTYPFHINKECQVSQPGATYCNNNNECTDCPTGCSNCTDGSHCSACIANYYLYQNLCSTPQPTHTFCNNSRECQQCHSECATCDGTTNQDCLSCANTTKYLYQKQCHSSAPSGVNCDTNRVCADCPNGCATCSNATTCQTCNSNYYFYNNQCTIAQPSQTYCDANLICNDCGTDCATCSAANSNTACLTCQNTSKYQFSGQCVTTPNPDTFCDANKVCTQCSSVCATCSNSTSCNACAANYYLFQNQCTVNQPSGTICNAQMVCSACHLDCADCTAANSSSSCTACADTNKYLFQNSCFPSQPPKTYCDMDRVCSDCPSLCETCTSDTICQTCVPGNYLYQNFCYVSQPLHTFCDNSKVCNDCYADCETCIAANSASSCLTCQSGKFFYNSSCFATQPTGTGCALQGAQLFSTCEKCPVQCATCDGNLVCLTCSVNFPDFVNNDCVKYPDCQKPCATCELGTASTCSTCPTGFILKADSNGKSTCMCEKKSQTLSEDGTTCKDKETGMSEATTESMKTALDNASVATSGLAVVFAASSVFTGSGTAMLSQAFTLQKIFYLQLMNLEVPSFLKMFLQSIDGLGILKKYKMFNFFSLFMDSSGSDLDYNYKDMEVRGGVFSNAGGALSVEIVLGLVQALFVFLIGQSKESIAFKAYSMVFCGMMLQMLPLLAFAIVDTIGIELILIPNLTGNYEIGVSALLLLVCFVNVVAIFAFLGKIYFRNPVVENVLLADLQSEKTIASYVKVKQVQSSPQSNQQLNNGKQQQGIIMKEIELQLRRDTIAEKFPSRTYMFFYNIIECVLFPLVSVLARGNFMISIIVLSSLQLSELCYTLKIRPFFNKITNVSFIIEQLILFLAFASYFTLGIMLNSLEQDESSTELPQSIVVASFLVSAFSLLAIIVNPVIQMMLIYQSLKASFAAKAKTKFLGKFTNFEMSVFASVELARKQNIEFPLGKQEPWSIDD